MPDEASKTTGLTGLPKVIEALGLAGAMLLFMGYMIYHNLETIPAAIKDLKAGHEASVKISNEQLDKERERGEKNRVHGEEQIKAAYVRSRERDEKLVERLEKNGATQQKQAEILNEIRLLLSKGKSNEVPKP